MSDVSGTGYEAVLSASVAGSLKSSATRSNARRNVVGKALPRFSARRRIPLQAVALKKYRCGTSPVSKMSDNEDAAAALWNSEVLSVKNSVCDPIPELPQHPEEGSERPSSVDRQDAGDVLPNQPAGPQSASKASVLDRELATRSVHSRSESGDAEVLARGSAHEKIDWLMLCVLNLCEVAAVGHIRIMVREH